MPPQRVMLVRNSGAGGRNDVNCSVSVVVAGVVGDDDDDDVV